MGGKTQTSTQQVTIPPEVMARYNAVNTRAENTAEQPFLQYSQDPNAFVAPLTGTQRAGIYNTNQAAGMSQPYFNAATGMTFGGAQGVGPLTQDQIGYYQNPFTQSVVDSTRAGLQQQQGQQLSQQQTEAIKAGAFGGDRAGIQRAQLMGQQGLATAQAISPLYQRGYEQALQAAQGQQGVRAADLQRQLAAGQQLGGLGAAAQQSALAGAQAQIGAGTAEQQTQQAGMQAIYNQFLQERGYPFQIAQFLANIAMGTGALSGSTTTTQQPAPFFSDEREKTNVQPLGEGMYAYDYIDDVRRAEEEGRPMPPKRVGPMAQDIEERAPGLVGEIGGHKVVDAEGGLGRLGYQSMGGMVSGPGAYATGGSIVGSEDMRSILAAIGQPLEFYGGKGLYGGATKGGAGSPGYVPAGQVGTPKLVTAGGMPRMPESGLSQAAQTGSQIAGLLKMGKEGLVGSPATSQSAKTSGPLGSGGKTGEGGWFSGLGGGRPGPSTAEPPAPRGADRVAEALKPVEYPNQYAEAMPVDPNEFLPTARGGFMRPHYDLGGSLPYGTDDQGEDPLGDVLKEGSAQQRQLATPGKAPAPTPGLGSELMQLGSLAKSAQGLSGMLPAGLTEGISGAASGIGSGIAGLGTAAAEGIGAIGSGLAAGGAELLAMLPLLFSDERMKDNIEAVGELYDGQPIYRYNMKGSPKTQLGLMAQDVERNGHSDAVAGLGGVKMVDYKRATDVAAGLAGRNHAYRGGYQEGDVVPYEDLPAPGAIEVARRDPSEFAETINSAAKQYGVDPRILRALIQRESSFDPEAVGSVGEIGLGQIKPSTARDPGYGVRPVSVEDLRQPEVNIPFAAEYLSKKARHLGHDPNSMEALMAYNAGPSAGEYAKKVMNTAGLGGANLPARVSEASPERATGVAGGERPERVTPGLAGPGRGPMDPASAPWYTLTRAARGKEGKESPVGEALMSENLWIPALAGIGSMLASKSPYLAGAVGEGLQGGTAAYTGLQKLQQDMGESRARTETAVAGIAGGSLQVVDGRLMVRYLRPDGRYDFIEYQTIRSMSPADRLKYRIDPRDLEQAEQLVGTTTSGAGAGAGAAAGAPAAPPAAPPLAPPLAPPAAPPAAPPVAPPVAPPAARRSTTAMPHEIAPPVSQVSRPTTVSGIGLTPEQVTQARALTEERAGFNQSDREKYPDLFTPQIDIARQSENTKQQIVPLVGALAALPRGSNIAASGVTQSVVGPIMSVANNLASMLGYRLGTEDPRALQQEIEKLTVRLQGQQLSSTQQRAFAAFQELAKGVPTYLNSPDGQALLIPQLLSETQREIDRRNFFEAWKNAAAGERGGNAQYARLSSQDANIAFENEFNEGLYSKERAALQRMFKETFPITDPQTGEKKRVSSMEYITKYGGMMTPEQKQSFRDKFGAGLKHDPLRYFGVN